MLIFLLIVLAYGLGVMTGQMELEDGINDINY